MYTGFGTIITAAITPFTDNGEVNYDEYRRLLQYLVAHGSDGIVVSGTTGESPTLTDAEKLELIRVAVDEIGSVTPIIAGTGSNNTAHSVELTEAAVAAGATGILAVTPYYNKPPRAGLVQHFHAIAGAAGDVPVMLYNIPGRSVIKLEPDLIAELAEVPNIVALKQATPELPDLREIRALAPDLAVYAGDDTSVLPMLSEGIVGVVSVASHVVGERMGEIFALYRSGQTSEATELAQRLEDVYETLSITSNPIPVKGAMELLGFSVGTPRLPLVAATGTQMDQLRAMLDRVGVVAANA